ncbi:MAG: hypothetical protein WBV40_11610 [Candidatus Cybelea sp.]
MATLNSAILSPSPFALRPSTTALRASAQDDKLRAEFTLSERSESKG